MTADLTVADLDKKVHFEGKVGPDGSWIPNQYTCPHCKQWGREHTVVKDIPHGFTDARSTWGAGLPTTRMQCDCCGRWSGPWVSAEIVGGGW